MNIQRANSYLRMVSCLIKTKPMDGHYSYLGRFFNHIPMCRLSLLSVIIFDFFSKLQTPPPALITHTHLYHNPNSEFPGQSEIRNQLLLHSSPACSPSTTSVAFAHFSTFLCYTHLRSHHSPLCVVS